MVSECGCRSSRKSDDGASTTGVGELLERQGVGGGVFEYRIDFGPGYRVYFGKDGDAVVILLGGGTKKRQDRDIAAAHDRWADYKKRKTEEK
ncbi:MAG TPA: type II toxin-antitoxin system RelE/ParE family toxin [Gemmatimonadaceae bacterium]